MDKDTALKLALELLAVSTFYSPDLQAKRTEVITAGLKALSQNVQEPVAQAWDEGYRAGIDDERTSEANIGIAGMGMKVEPARNNPYHTTPPAAQPAPVQEPVAYMFEFPDKRLAPKFDSAPHGGNWQPLYTTPPAQPAPVQGTMQQLREKLENPSYSHALAYQNIREALEIVLRWIDDYCETGPENDFERVEKIAVAALATPPAAQPAPVQPVAWPIDEDVAKRIAEKQFVSYEVVQLIAREICATPPTQSAPVQDLPFGVGGGLVAIKTLLSRDPCAHAKTAIEMIDAMLAAPAAQPSNIPSEITCPFCESTHVPGWLHDMKCDALGITEKGHP